MITVKTTMKAPINKVWEAFTKAEHITQWNFAHPSWCCPKSTVDLKVGGEMNNRMEAVDGSMGFDLKAVFDEVTPEQRLNYTLEDGRKVLCSFTSNGEEVELIQQFEAEKENPEEMQQQGWQAILDNFKKHVESL